MVRNIGNTFGNILGTLATRLGTGTWLGTGNHSWERFGNIGTLGTSLTLETSVGNMGTPVGTSVGNIGNIGWEHRWEHWNIGLPEMASKLVAQVI